MGSSVGEGLLQKVGRIVREYHGELNIYTFQLAIGLEVSIKMDLPPKKTFNSIDDLFLDLGELVAQAELSRQDEAPKTVETSKQPKVPVTPEHTHQQDPIFKPVGVQGTRVYPLAYYAPLQWFPAQTQPPIAAQWDDPTRAVPEPERKRYDADHKKHVMKWQPGSVTCIVNLTNNSDPIAVYMLTVGHAFWDMDRYRNKSSNEDQEVGRPSNVLSCWWGEHDLAVVKAIGPHSESYGRYYRMGDKLGSKVDCGLARIRNGVAWSNQCLLLSEKADHKDVTSTPKWVAPNTITFKIRTEAGELARARFMTLVVEAAPGGKIPLPRVDVCALGL